MSNINRIQLYKDLITLANENFVRFSNRNHSYCEEISNLCLTILLEAPKCLENSEKLLVVCAKFDFDENTPGNGLRSLVKVLDSCAKRIMQIFDTAPLQRRTRIFFRSEKFFRELQCFVDTFLCTGQYADCLAEYFEVEKSSFLFESWPQKEEMKVMQSKILQLDNSCFYGRANGFQFHPSLERIFKATEIAKSAFHSAFSRKFQLSCWKPIFEEFLSHLRCPERRAGKTVHVIRTADIHFTKYFWDICERGIMIPTLHLVSPTVEVNKVFMVNANSSLLLTGKNNQKVEIPPPTAHNGLKNIRVRLVSKNALLGMEHCIEGVSNNPPSDYLIFHCHGGGFCANSSKTHENYLRTWAQNLGCPILSVDYSLAPESPYPRALQEVLYMYAWVLNNPEKLGWTGQQFIMVGDSAGANLVTVVTLRAIELGIEKLSVGMVLFYGGYLFEIYPSPARILLNTDPIVTLGCLLSCYNAYYGNQNDPAKFLDDPGQALTEQFLSNNFSSVSGNKEKVSGDVAASRKTQSMTTTSMRPLTDQPPANGKGHGLPLRSESAQDNFLLLSLVLQHIVCVYVKVGDLDPALDDSVMFARRLGNLKVPVTLDILEDLPHGFLMYGWMGSKQCQEATDQSTDVIRRALNLKST